MRKREQLAGHDFIQAVDTGNTVAQRDDGTDFIDGDLRFVVLDLLANQLGDFVWSDWHSLASGSYLLPLRSLANVAVEILGFRQKSYARADKEPKSTG